ncbi:hypothetical protein [Cyclobacterium amurskyense]|uniref:hypothetical protein n=1 Tax=Cyclobacterium amurskyense TaxID=320787 RepID=UPI0030D8326E
MERLLLHDRQRGITIMTDFNGNPLLNMDKGGDQKDSYGRFLWSSANIKENEHISLVSQKGFFEFDSKGNLAKHKPFEEEVPFFAGRAAADSELMKHHGILFQKGLVAWDEYNKTQDEYYDQFQLLVKFDPEKGTAERIINLEENSPFRNSRRSYEISEMNPCFTIFEDKLFVIAGTDPHLNVYDIHSPHQLLDRKHIDYPNYTMGEGEDRGKADPKSIAFDMSAGRTYTLKAYKDYLIASYNPGYDSKDKEKYKMEAKYPNALLLMNHQGETIQSLALPDKLDHRQFLVRDGELWWLSKLNTEKEEDFIQIYKVKIINKK